MQKVFKGLDQWIEYCHFDGPYSKENVRACYPTALDIKTYQVLAILGIERKLCDMDGMKKERAGDDPASTFLKEPEAMKMVKFSQDEEEEPSRKR